MLSFFQLHDSNMFMHNSAPWHSLKSAQKWLRDGNIRILDWPGNSPDSDPIEKMWLILTKNK